MALSVRGGGKRRACRPATDDNAAMEVSGKSRMREYGCTAPNGKGLRPWQRNGKAEPAP